MGSVPNGVVLPMEDPLDTLDSVVDGISGVHLTMSNIYRVEIIDDQLPGWGSIAIGKWVCEAAPKRIDTTRAIRLMG